MSLYRLQLIGPFCLFGPDGARVDIQSRKGSALVAMLAMARGGERTRGWLQDHLWGLRHQQQAQGSLRSELLKLRETLGGRENSLILTDSDRVRLDLTRVTVDAHHIETIGQSPRPSDHLLPGEFLEGLDIAGEDGLEDWLREQRAAIAERLALLRARTSTTAPPAPVVAANGASHPAVSRSAIDERPSIAVLPFDNLTGSTDSAYLADGLRAELIDGMSRLRWMPVIAASSSFAYRDPSTDHQVVAQALGVRYLLEGRLSGTLGEYHLVASVSDTRSGRIIWSRRLDLPSMLSRAMIDTLVRELVGGLDAGVDFAEQERALAVRTEDLSVNEMVWRARWHMNQYTREDAVVAQRLLDKAIVAQPGSPDALIQATYSTAWSIWSLRKPATQIREMRRLAQRAIAADPLDGRGHMLAGMAEAWLRRPAQAKLLLTHAISLNPSLCHAHAMLGSTYYLNGEPGEAIAPLETALRLSPHDDQTFRTLGELAIAQWMLDNHGQAVDYADQSLIRRPAYWYAHVARIAAFVRAGDLGAARHARAELQDSKPGFSVENIDWLPFVDRAWPDTLKDTLRQSE